MSTSSDRPSFSASQEALAEANSARKRAEARASVLAMAAQYLIGDVKAVMEKYPEMAASLEAAIYRYEERIR